VGLLAHPLENFNIFEYQITNVSGHELDSVYVAFPIDMDCGPTLISNYFIDDLDIPSSRAGSTCSSSRTTT
jgi:hypothetical protein